MQVKPFSVNPSKPGVYQVKHEGCGPLHWSKWDGSQWYETSGLPAYAIKATDASFSIPNDCYQGWIDTQEVQSPSVLSVDDKIEMVSKLLRAGEKKASINLIGDLF